MRLRLTLYLLSVIPVAVVADEPAGSPVPLPAPIAPVAPPPIPVDPTAAVRFRDNHGAWVSVRIPSALHRPANAFRLYGVRPLTLRSRERRRDLYRDAFLELATRSRLSPRTSVFDDLGQQMSWLGGVAQGQLASRGIALPAVRLDPGALNVPAASIPGDWLRELVRRGEASGLSGLGPQLQAMLKAIGTVETPAEAPVRQVLALRALATDAAEERLRRAGVMLGLAGRSAPPGSDRAVWEGFRAAQAEFAEVRTNLWGAVASAVRRNQGQLVATAVKRIVLSRLGGWALFGYLGWQVAESNLNLEYHGQYAAALATLADLLAAAEASGKGVAGESLARYAEFVSNYELTEAFKRGQWLAAFRPAGGRSEASWQIRFSERMQQLKPLLSTPGDTSGPVAAPGGGTSQPAVPPNGGKSM